MNVTCSDLCYQHKIRVMGTTGDADPIQVPYKVGLFHYECGNPNVSLHRKIKSHRFMYSLPATTIICVLQVIIIADLQTLFMYVTSRSWCIWAVAFKTTHDVAACTQVWHDLDFFMCYTCCLVQY
jgi:hypothetical protein